MSAGPEQSSQQRAEFEDQVVDGPPPGAPPGLGRTLLSGASWQSLGQIAPLIINLMLTPWVIRTLGLSAYAMFLIVNSIVAFMGTFDGGIGPSSQRFFTIYAGQNDRRATTRLLTTLIGLVTIVALVVFTLLFLAAPAIVDFFHSPADLRSDTIFLLRTMVVIVGIAVVRQLFATVLYAQQRFRLASLSGLLGYAVYTVGLVWSLRVGADLRGIAYTFMAQQALATALIVPFALRHLEFAHPLFMSKSELRYFLGFAWKAQVASVMEQAGLQGDVLIVGRFAHAQAAHFGPGSQFAFQLRTIITQAGQSPMQAAIGRMVGASGEAGAKQGFEQVMRAWVTVVSGWVAIGVPACYFGVTEWLDLGSSLPGVVAAVLLVGHLFPMLSLPLLLWALSVGRPEIDMRYGVASVTLNIALTLALIVPLGVIGSVVATAVAQCVAMLILMRMIQRMTTTQVAMPVSFVKIVPVLTACLLSLAGVFAASRLVEMGWVPRGTGFALIVCGMGAIPAVLYYLNATFGLSRAVAFARSRTSN